MKSIRFLSAIALLAASLHPAFAADARAQLQFVYRRSPWYEPAHMRYPVYRIMK